MELENALDVGQKNVKKGNPKRKKENKQNKIY